MNTKAIHFNWIDYAKALAIFLVVLLHVHCDIVADQLIDGMIIPAFLIISGFLFDYGRNPDYRTFLVKRFRQLIIPYLWIGAIAYLAWFWFLRNYGTNPGDADIWYEPLAGMIAGVPPMLSHDIPLWSLLSFFVVEAIYYPLARWLKHDAAIIALSFALTYLCYSLIPTALGALPLALGPSVCGLGFYASGRILRRIFDARHEAFDRMFSYPALVGWGCVFVLSAMSNDIVSFYTCRYGNFAVFLCSSYAGALLLVGLAIRISAFVRSGRENIVIRLASKGSLLICGLHLLVFASLKGIMLFGFHIPPERFSEGLLVGVLFATVSFLCCLPIIYVIDRYLRFLVAK